MSPSIPLSLRLAVSALMSVSLASSVPRPCPNPCPGLHPPVSSATSQPKVSALPSMPALTQMPGLSSLPEMSPLPRPCCPPPRCRRCPLTLPSAVDVPFRAVDADAAAVAAAQTRRRRCRRSPRVPPQRRPPTPGSVPVPPPVLSPSPTARVHPPARAFSARRPPPVRAGPASYAHPPQPPTPAQRTPSARPTPPALHIHSDAATRERIGHSAPRCDLRTRAPRARPLESGRYSSLCCVLLCGSERRARSAYIGGRSRGRARRCACVWRALPEEPLVSPSLTRRHRTRKGTRARVRSRPRPDRCGSNQIPAPPPGACTRAIVEHRPSIQISISDKAIVRASRARTDAQMILGGVQWARHARRPSPAHRNAIAAPPAPRLASPSHPTHDAPHPRGEDARARSLPRVNIEYRTRRRDDSRKRRRRGRRARCPRGAREGEVALRIISRGGDTADAPYCWGWDAAGERSCGL
ncbi:hypothetical protein HYPSUDRAFT_200089 [Hypholoma sublateritium FD-334 SS-4]|uniref:Uncharacterized protein n=1 Tax=Hypholoma sublateritium (strain FD-334 SS-4) TaxID=945553 RepID=A0A0D2LD11_HYPSF|nr:hypothetical protein HYPSUDRAFT_200089 [Hypholoma sublateritium FD-334 SS-4]